MEFDKDILNIIVTAVRAEPGKTVQPTHHILGCGWRWRATRTVEGTRLRDEDRDRSKHILYHEFRRWGHQTCMRRSAQNQLASSTKFG